jgi:hypothetical protein
MEHPILTIEKADSMTEWNPKTEQLIRDLSDYIDLQFRDIIDPKASTLGTSSRLAFRHASTGAKLMERAQSELGMKPETWDADVERVIKLAKDNGSNAADKMEKIVPVVKQLSKEFGLGPGNVHAGKLEQMKRLKQVKKKGIKLD